MSEIKSLLTALSQGAPLAEQVKSSYNVNLADLYHALAEQVAKSKFASKDSLALQGDGPKP
jgi:hypothetical protein